jgi:hypothetical protein
MDELAQYDAEHEFLQRCTIPEEDQAKYTSAMWAGEYRWFRSPNVVCLEKARLLKEKTSTGGGAVA